MTGNQNHFTDVISDIQDVPQNQRTDKLIDSIAATMQQAGNTPPSQLAQELKSAKPQLVKACQQGSQT